ncbi:hypothetical protein A3F03_01895 [Candidatus Roizmanbacteria bacterium RIFCSPHIGHO2_12_FULL_41_11]|uniref:Adenylate kinase n=1 Tax=Candidatus Roizmanbacteria bacterium RIFCSPHIGHO2_12_FULL_41_11 TaxID=1802052 RepID=A0A1F7I4M5_9BACT|nr:MAG: hypothetical protein A3F03_01895 [Candidatus Roizmanbacteria bacterium RIFCSPHIGHO2_12_FULL_41_11]
MKLVLIGIQGSGKSTQGNLLSKQLKIPYLSTGHIFRAIAKEKTKLGHEVKLLMSSGLLIPDDLTIEIVNTYLSKPEYKRGYILDGFPRTLKQAKLYKNNVDKVIYLEVPDKEALWRLAYRKDNRDDNTVKAIVKRIELFHKHTSAVIKYYEEEGKLVTIDGTEKIEKVNRNILKSLGKQLIKNQIKTWQQKKKAIIAIVGLPGSGKTEAANFFVHKNVPIVKFGQVLNDYIDQHQLKHDEKTHRRLREGWRKKRGADVFAQMNEQYIRESLKKKSIVVVEGMRSWEECLYLKKRFPEVRIYILNIYADKDIRRERAAGRKYRPKLWGEEREINELLGTNMGPTIAMADFLIKNNYSLEQFHDKLEEVDRVVYFA